jgi:predicted RNA-binding protein with RPS1 domain
MEKLIVIAKDELIETIDLSIKKALYEYDKQKKRNEPEKTFTINQVSKKLGMSFSTVKKRIDEGIIKTAKDGRIPESSINEYLQRT